MKSLLYKEFKLAWHPLCYVFPIMFSLFMLFPNYPPFIGLMIVLASYTFLFLGTSKGKQTNDLAYTISLPVSKKQIVLARMISMVLLQAIAIVLTVALAPVANVIKNAIGQSDKIIGLSYSAIGVTISFGLIGYVIADALYILLFYKNGRSLLLPSILSIVIYAIIMVLFCIVLPITVKSYYSFFCSKVWVQFVTLAIALAIYVPAHVLIAKAGVKRISKINF